MVPSQTDSKALLGLMFCRKRTKQWDLPRIFVEPKELLGTIPHFFVRGYTPRRAVAPPRENILESGPRADNLTQGRKDATTQTPARIPGSESGSARIGD